MAPSDRQLLRRTHAGHEASAREFWDRHAGWMRAFARSSLGGRRDAAEDVVQTVFCRILELDRRTIRSVSDVAPWLASAVRNSALNHLRAARRAESRESRRASPNAGHATPDSSLAAAIESLPRHLRDVVHLRHVAGLTTAQTALALGVPRGTIASRHHAAIGKLRDLLDPDRPRDAQESSSAFATQPPRGGVHAPAL